MKGLMMSGSDGSRSCVRVVRENSSLSCVILRVRGATGGARVSLWGGQGQGKDGVDQQSVTLCGRMISTGIHWDTHVGVATWETSMQGARWDGERCGVRGAANAREQSTEHSAYTVHLITARPHLTRCGLSDEPAGAVADKSDTTKLGAPGSWWVRFDCLRILAESAFPARTVPRN